MVVRPIKNVNIRDREELLKTENCLLVSYKNICLAIEGGSTMLNTFVKQIKTNPYFAENIFKQALAETDKTT